MSDYEIIQVLSQYEEQFQVYDLVSYLLRSLGWILVKFLYTILEGVEGLLDEVYTLMGLLTSAPVKGFVQIFHTSVKRWPVAENKVWNRNAQQPDSLLFDKCEVLFRNKCITVLLHLFF